MLTHYETIVTLLVGIIALLSSLVIGIRWIYRQGSASNAQIRATNENTSATRDLTANFREFTTATSNTLLDLEKRMVRLETTTEIQRAANKT